MGVQRNGWCPVLKGVGKHPFYAPPRAVGHILLVLKKMKVKKENLF